MAIALPLAPSGDELESPWPRPALRLVDPNGLWERPAGPTPGSEAPEDSEPAAVLPGALRVLEPEPAAIRLGGDVAVRRHRRASRRVRRRRVAVVALVAGVSVLLALPVSALGGRAVRTPATAAATTAAAGGAVSTGSVAVGSVYVVQPGDTLWSIAGRIAGATDTRAVVRALAVQSGSQIAWPGERLRIP